MTTPFLITSTEKKRNKTKLFNLVIKDIISRELINKANTIVGGKDSSRQPAA